MLSYLLIVQLYYLKRLKATSRKVSLLFYEEISCSYFYFDSDLFISGAPLEMYLFSTLHNWLCLFGWRFSSPTELWDISQVPQTHKLWNWIHHFSHPLEYPPVFLGWNNYLSNFQGRNHGNHLWLFPHPNGMYHINKIQYLICTIFSHPEHHHFQYTLLQYIFFGLLSEFESLQRIYHTAVKWKKKWNENLILELLCLKCLWLPVILKGKNTTNSLTFLHATFFLMIWLLLYPQPHVLSFLPILNHFQFPRM